MSNERRRLYELSRSHKKAQERQRVEREKERKRKEQRVEKRRLASQSLKAADKLRLDGNYSGAKKKYREAIDAKVLTKAALASAFAGLGRVEYELINFAQSVRQLRLSVSKVSTNAERWYRLGLSYFQAEE